MPPDATPGAHGRRLDSWKEIAAYLDRDVRTVQRWERTDELPVRRLQHSKLASVYAYAGELDDWRARREPADATADPPAAVAGRGRRRWWIPAALSLALILVAIAGLWTRTNRTPPAPAGGAPIRAIAVLPIANFSGDPQQEYFADGMTDALIARLSMLPGLLVISRTSVMPFKNSQRSVPEIATALGVDGVVEGSVTRAGHRVRITVKLIRAATDTTIFAQAFDRDAADAYAGTGRRADAGRIVDELTSMARSSYVPPAALVTAYAGLGDLDRAFAALEQAYGERSNLMRSLRVLPLLDPLRADPRFQDMLRRVGLDDRTGS